MVEKPSAQSGMLHHNAHSPSGGSSITTPSDSEAHHRHRPNSVGVSDGIEFLISLIGMALLIVIGLAALAEVALNIGRL